MIDDSEEFNINNSFDSMEDVRTAYYYDINTRNFFSINLDDISSCHDTDDSNYDVILDSTKKGNKAIYTMDEKFYMKPSFSTAPTKGCLKKNYVITKVRTIIEYSFNTSLGKRTLMCPRVEYGQKVFNAEPSTEYHKRSVVVGYVYSQIFDETNEPTRVEHLKSLLSFFKEDNGL